MSIRNLLGAMLVAIFSLALVLPTYAADNIRQHRIAVQVDQDDPAVLNLALNNVANLADHYRKQGEAFQIEVVAFGPGLHMLRDDTSPVKDRIKRLVESLPPTSIRFSACANTKEGMEKREGRAIVLIPQASLVPSGVVRLTELQEQGWTYLRP